MIDCAPTKARLAAVRGAGKVFGMLTVYYAEHGAGAEIVSKQGWLIADFPNHLDAEKFMGMLQDAKAANVPAR